MIPPQDLYGYFDYAASCPPHPEALEEYARASAERFGNPSSTHRRGMEARKLLESAKQRILRALHLPEQTAVIATSGGTEANNLVLESFLTAGAGRVAVAADAHPSAWYVTRAYSARVDVVPVDGRGRISPKALEQALGPSHGLVSLVHANNETGVVQDVAALWEVCRKKGVAVHLDGVQALGRVSLDLPSLEGVFVTFSAHKFGAPRGVGGILTGSPERLVPRIHGGRQESGLRAGTENAAGLAACATALEITVRDRPEVSRRLREFWRLVIERVMARFPGTVLNSGPDGLPDILSLSVPGLNGATAVTEMAMRGFDVSAGAACHAGAAEPSRVIRAMGRDRVTALGTLRISMGYGTEPAEVEAMAEALLEVIERGLEVG